MSHQRRRLKYFPMVRPWLDLPQRLQWERAATTSLWQVLSFAPVNNTSPLLLIKDLESNGPFCWSDQIISFPESLPHQVRLAPTPRLFVAPTLVITVSSNLSTKIVNNISNNYLISVCRIWRKLDGLDKSDVHVRVDHLCQDLECPASSDFLHGFL